MSRGPVLGVTGAMRLISQKLDQRAYARAVRASEIAVELHTNAPRGGPNTNRYGQLRSAGGEQPAVEEGNLLQLLEVPPVPTPDGRGYALTANYVVLEFGTRDARIAPRPMGRMTTTKLKQEVNGGGS